MRREALVGGAYAAAAFLFWGLAPLYWRLLRHVPGWEMVAHRVVWAMPVMWALVVWRGRRRDALAAMLDLRHVRLLLVTGLLVTVNWLVFILAIQRDLVLHASLGYYVNPLVNVLLGYAFLGERLGRRQAVAVALAGVGVLWLTLSLGAVPWVALVLAGTFGVYGLLRKQAGVDALVGLTVETTLMAPLGLLGLVLLVALGESSFPEEDLPGLLLILSCGLVTALPLLWFANGARRLRYATIGFFQYLAPTGQFLLAVLVFGEPFGAAHAVAFAFIWVAVALYLAGAARGPRVVSGSPLPAAAPRRA